MSTHSRIGMPPMVRTLDMPAVAGAPPSFDEVYRGHVSFVWRSMRHLGVAEADAEDAVQDVFVVVHDKLASFEGRAKITTWIYGICIRIAQARRRRAHARHELATDPDEIVIAETAADAGESFERREAEGLLDQILDAMPLEQRAAFTLFELDGRSCEEIAVLTGAPLGTVYSRLRLARETFRRATKRLEAQAKFQTGGAR